MAKVSVPDHDLTTCWLWTGTYNKRTGYGYFYLDRKLVGAHRASYLLFQGDIPAGQVVMHACDVRLCVRPAHLSLGTHADNMRDKCQKGRNYAGSWTPGDSITEYDREPGWLRHALSEASQLGISARLPRG